MRERKIFWNRWITALKETEVPIELIWGQEDRITDDCISNLESEDVVINNISWIKKTGHFPMLESPKEWLQCVLKK